MRKDMDKILVTNPRIGSSWKNFQVKKERRVFRDGVYDLPAYSSMKPKGKETFCERKSLNEYLNPLARFLSKNVGRKWNSVYSEICRYMDKRTAVQNHIFQHLFDYVERNPVFINGEPHYPTAGHWFGDRYAKMYKNGWVFYVDKKGILREPKCVDKRFLKNKYKNDNVLFTDNDNRFYIKRVSDNVWFQADLVQPKAIGDNGIPEWIRKEIFMSDLWSKIGGRKLALKTLSKKQKRNLNLT